MQLIVYTQSSVKKVLFQTILFSVSMQFKFQTIQFSINT